MPFYSNLGGIREWGRKLVLPVGRIKALLKNEVFHHKNINEIIDFGAGTLYWTKWFHEVTEPENVYSVDVIFKSSTLPRCFSSIKDVPYKQNNTGLRLFFTCDVLHHLSENEWEEIKEIVCRDFDFVVIKDINCRYKVKNWMNRMHDRIINGEHIRDVDPELLISDLHSAGYHCIYHDIHKLWYPHFIIIAKKEDQ